MICNKCGHQIPDDANFCSNCGNQTKEEQPAESCEKAEENLNQECPTSSNSDEVTEDEPGQQDCDKEAEQEHASAEDESPALSSEEQPKDNPTYNPIQSQSSKPKITDTINSFIDKANLGVIAGIAAVIVVILVIITLFGTHIICFHNWEEATCTTPKTCSICKKTEGTTLGHDWKEATCTEPETCTRCGQTRMAKLGHDMPDPTCTESSTCSRCGEYFEALGHDWKEATCTEPKTCSRCGLTEGDPLGHTTSNGTCERCGLEFFETINGYGDDVVSDITVTSKGIYRVHFTYDGSSNFIVWCNGTSSSEDLLVNTIGSYDGYVLLGTKDTYSFEINASGPWTYTIEKLDTSGTTDISGSGDYVTNLIADGSGVWHFTHDGTSNFIVWMQSSSDRDLLVNKIGDYDGNKKISVKGYMYLEITADGNWTAVKQ